MFATKTVLVASVLIANGLSTAEKQPLDAKKVVGHWRSVKLEGKDIGTRIVGIEAEFWKDGRVTLIAKLKQEGDIKSITKNGKYKIAMKELEWTFDNETRRSKAWFQEDHLVIQDPQLDSRVHYERVTSKK